MALSTEALGEIRLLLEGDTPVAERCASVRKSFPGLSLTRCDAGDMSTETPTFETSELCVYLIDTSEHCVRITGDPAAATGLIVAQKR
ncbi:uncharacterized protein sS8_5437 [Methylocaldum marinum]|uniref:Uncharacterized protein n=1 Tax=Methylocaldum marinum TaxID=1432792 RepID=A0A250L0T9_9GAMM|nr:hypothetical protein [Methylocaldum marinum]BBA37354.1 uncharacterized protein sS8_5437 [Methylocaldum marinum]